MHGRRYETRTELDYHRELLIAAIVGLAIFYIASALGWFHRHRDYDMDGSGVRLEYSSTGVQRDGDFEPRKRPMALPGDSERGTGGYCGTALVGRRIQSSRF